MHRERLLHYIEEIKSGEIERANLKQFIEICLEIAVTYLNSKYYKYINSFSQIGLTFKDISIDAVTPLFISKNSRNLTGFQKSLSLWRKEIDSESNASFFVHKLIWKRIDQTVVTLLSEIDPVSSKLLKNVIYNAKNNGYKKAKYFSQICLVEDCIHIIDKPVISKEDFSKIPLSYFKGSLNNVIAKLFDYVKTLPQYFSAIPVNLFVAKLKLLYYENTSEPKLYEEQFEILIGIDNLINSSIKKTFSKIRVDYVLKNKLTEQEENYFQLAMMDIVRDLKDGGMNCGIEEYLKPYFSNTPVKDLRDRYHNIFDYLIRMLKKDIAAGLESEQFS